MRILILTTTFARFPGDPLGGLGNCFLDLCLEMSKSVKVDVVTPMVNGARRYKKIDNLTIYRVSPNKPHTSLESIIKTINILKIPPILINVYREAFKLTKANNYDVIHGFFIVPSGFLVALLPGKEIKVISGLGTDVHTLGQKLIIQKLYRYIFKNTNGVIYNTPSMKNRLNQLQAKNLEYIPTPLNRQIFKLYSTLPGTPHFAFVGRLVKTKGVEILLKAFRKVLNDLPKAKLVIIGDGPEKAEMLKFILKNKLQKSIQLVGVLSSSEISTILKNSYALLLPSFREGTPASVLEAMSVGRPIVATKVGSLKNLVTGEVGYLTDIGNIDQFAKAIIAAYKTDFVPNKISKKTQKFDSKVVAKQYLDYYQKIQAIYR